MTDNYIFNAFGMQLATVKPHLIENMSIYSGFLRLSLVLSCLKIRIGEVFLFYHTHVRQEFTVITFRW